MKDELKSQATSIRNKGSKADSIMESSDTRSPHPVNQETLIALIHQLSENYNKQIREQNAAITLLFENQRTHNEKINSLSEQLKTAILKRRRRRQWFQQNEEGKSNHESLEIDYPGAD